MSVTAWTTDLVEARLREQITATSPSRERRETQSWLAWLEPQDAEIIRARAAGAPWKLICWRFGIGRATAHRRWTYGLALIAWRLSGRTVPPNWSRRRFLEAVRASARA